MRKYSWLIWIVIAGFAVRLGAWLYFYFDTSALVVSRLPDDALYYFAIAKNLASGIGISFDGVHPTNGMHPLWLFVISPIFLLGLSKWGAIYGVLLLQSIIDAVIIWFIGKTVYDALANTSESTRRRAAGASALLYALSFLATVRAINGLETTIVSLLTVFWIRAFLKRNEFDTPLWIAFGLLTGLLLLARTDTFILLVPLAVSFGASELKRHWREYFTAFCATILTILPWIWWNWATFGTPLQSSAEAVPILAMRKYAAIYGSGVPTYWHLLLEAIRNVFKPFWYSTLGFSILTLAFTLGVRRKSIGSNHKAIILFAIGGLLLLVVHSLFRGFIRDWYVEELTPIFLIVYGVSIGINAGQAGLSKGVWRLAVVILVLQAIIFFRAPYRSQLVVVERGVPLIRDLTARTTVASLNSGFYGYFSSRPGSVVNLDGVVNADAVHALEASDLHGLLDRDSVRYLIEFQGDLGGYINLIDHHMLDDFVVDSIVTSGHPGVDPLYLYRRKS